MTGQRPQKTLAFLCVILTGGLRVNGATPGNPLVGNPNTDPVLSQNLLPFVVALRTRSHFRMSLWPRPSN